MKSIFGPLLVMLLCVGCSPSPLESTDESLFPTGFDLFVSRWEADFEKHKIILLFTKPNDKPGFMLVYSAVPNKLPSNVNPMIGNQILYKLADCEIRTDTNPITVVVNEFEQRLLTIFVVTSSQLNVTGLDALVSVDYEVQYPGTPPFMFPVGSVTFHLVPPKKLSKVDSSTSRLN